MLCPTFGTTSSCGSIALIVESYWSSWQARFETCKFHFQSFNTGDRTNFTRGHLSPNLQARICKLYPADFVVWNWVIQGNSWFPKNGNQGSLYLYTMPGCFFQIGRRVKKPTRLALPEKREKQGGGVWTKHKQILKARNTQTSKLQLKNRQDRACRIKLADLLVKWFEERSEARVTSQLDKRNLSIDLSSSTCAQNTSVGPWVLVGFAMRGAAQE